MFSVRLNLIASGNVFLCFREEKINVKSNTINLQTRFFPQYRSCFAFRISEAITTSQNHQTMSSVLSRPWRLGAKFRDVCLKAVSASRFRCWTDFTMTLAQKGILARNTGRNSKTKTIILIIILTSYHVNMPSKSDNREVERKLPCAVLCWKKWRLPTRTGKNSAFKAENALKAMSTTHQEVGNFVVNGSLAKLIEKRE